MAPWRDEKGPESMFAQKKFHFQIMGYKNYILNFTYF